MDSSARNPGKELLESSSQNLVLLQQHDMFAREAFIYLLDHFGIQPNKAWSKFRFFTEAMGRAVVTLSYIFRRRLRTFFLEGQIDVSSFSEFQKFAKYFELIESPCFFYRILRRISHIFELTIYCLMRGYNYIEAALSIVVYHEYIIFFETSGGWSRLNETASFIAEVGELLQLVIQDEKPQDMILKSFVKSVQGIEINPSIPHPRKDIVSLFKCDVVRKLSDIHTIDPRVTIVFYNTICQHSSNVFAMNSEVVYEPWKCRRELKLDIQSEMEGIINSFRNQLKMILCETENSYLSSSGTLKLAGYFANFRHLSDMISTEFDMHPTKYETEVQSRLSLSEGESCQSWESCNKYFIVNCDYIREVISSEMENSQEGSIVSKVGNILKHNFDQNNYFQLTDGRYVVYTPGCKFDSNTTVILRTSC